MRYVFRNNTVERFFSKGYVFSGYDDISVIPTGFEYYVWWYQVPIKFERQVLAEEVNGYIQKFNFVLQQIDPDKMFVALTMEAFYDAPFTDDDSLLTKAVSDYNTALFETERSHTNLKVVDLGDFVRQYPVSELMDWKFYFISQMGMNPKLNKPFQAWWSRKLDSIALKRKKCLVLDLDNTLWGGVLGEDGADGIQIGGDYPGKAFLYWQEALIQLAKTGVILTICSKNNEQDVLEAWDKNPFILLKKDDFSAYRINWTDKVTNIRELADELNIGLDSMVFVDDNPTERELVKQMLPMVSVPDFPEHPYMLLEFFKQLVNDYFKVYSITEEDRKKAEQYKAAASRLRMQKKFADFDEFLESLDIQIIIEAVNEFNIQRIAQMTQKTNQFNLTTKRYTDADIRNFMTNGWKIWCISVADKFGNSGITGCAMVNGNKIDTFLLSCRILGKGIEIAFAKTLFKIFVSEGMLELKAQYIPTTKNMQVKDFYDKLGFSCIMEKENGNKEYALNLSSMDFSVKKYYHITVK